MKAYPSISTQVDFDCKYVVFDKLDGSNIRAEWSAKRGFYKHGSRHFLLTPSQVDLWPSIEAIGRHASDLDRALRIEKMDRAVCFFEWFGQNSFAGSHHIETDDMRVALLDVWPVHKPLLNPDRVLEIADRAQIQTPRVLHRGRVDVDFLLKVRAGELPGISFEGVVGKEARPNANHHPRAFKHKTQKWLDALKALCGSDQDRYLRLE